MSQQVEVTLAQAKDLIIDCIKTKRVPLLTSHPGMGKSALIKQIANEYNLELIDERVSSYTPVDANGLPYFNADHTKAKFIPMENFPLETDPLPEGKSGFLLFFDEFTSGTPSVIAALYKLILDRKVGNTRLHPRVVIIAAGNRTDSKAVVFKLGTAMQSRVIHLHIKSCLKEWLEYAYSKNFNHKITSFLNYKPQLLNNFDPDHENQTFACERTWHFMSDFMNSWEENISITKLPLFTGTVGEGVGRELYSFCQIYKDLPSVDNILAEPELAIVPQSPMNQWAIAGALGNHINNKNTENVMKYLLRLPVQFQVMALRQVIRKEPKLITNEHIYLWVQKHSKEME